MTIAPTRPQSIGGVLDTTFQLYRAALGRVFAVCFLLVAVGAVPGLLVLGPGPIRSAIERGGTDDIGALIGVLLLTGMVSGLLSIWFVGALYLQESAIGLGEDIGLASALGSALSRTLPLFFTFALGALLTALGLVLFIVPGLMLTVYLQLSANLVLFERKGPIDALLGSFHLVRGSWMRTTMILSVGVFIMSLLYFAASFGTALLIPLLSRGAATQTAMQISSFLATLGMNLLVTPFYVAMLIAIYWDLKLRREGQDLLPRIDALTSA